MSFPKDPNEWVDYVKNLADGKLLKIKNATPHDIVIYDSGMMREVQRYETGMQFSRVMMCINDGVLIDDGIAIDIAMGGGPNNVGFLPREEDGTLFIVSKLVADNMTGSDRYDLIYPDTSPGYVVKDATGAVIGCTRFLHKV